jgi:hypothetical protein
VLTSFQVLPQTKPTSGENGLGDLSFDNLGLSDVLQSSENASNASATPSRSSGTPPRPPLNNLNKVVSEDDFLESSSRIFCELFASSSNCFLVFQPETFYIVFRVLQRRRRRALAVLASGVTSTSFCRCRGREGILV